MDYYDGFTTYIQSDEYTSEYESWVETMEDAFADFDSYDDYEH